MSKKWDKLIGAWQYHFDTGAGFGSARPDTDPMWLSPDITLFGFKRGYKAAPTTLHEQEIALADKLAVDDNSCGAEVQIELLLQGKPVNQVWVEELEEKCSQVSLAGSWLHEEHKRKRLKANLCKLQSSVAELGEPIAPLPVCIEECFTSWVGMIVLHLSEGKKQPSFTNDDLTVFLSEILPLAGCVRYWPLRSRKTLCSSTDDTLLHYSLDVEGKFQLFVNRLTNRVSNSTSRTRYAKARDDQLKRAAQLDVLKAIAREVLAEDPASTSSAAYLARLDSANFTKRMNKQYASQLRHYCRSPSAETRAELLQLNENLQSRTLLFPEFDADAYNAQHSESLRLLSETMGSLDEAITLDEAKLFAMKFRDENVKRKVSKILESTIVLLPLEKHIENGNSLEEVSLAARIGSLANEYCKGMNTQQAEEEITHFVPIIARSLFAFKRTRSEFLASSLDRQRDLSDVPLLTKMLSLCKKFNPALEVGEKQSELLALWFGRFPTVGLTNNFITTLNSEGALAWKLHKDIADDIWRWNYSEYCGISKSDAELLFDVFTARHQEVADYLKYYGIDRKEILRVVGELREDVPDQGAKPKRKGSAQNEESKCLQTLHEYFVNLAASFMSTGRGGDRGRGNGRGVPGGRGQGPEVCLMQCQPLFRPAQELLRAGQCRMGAALASSFTISDDLKANMMTAMLREWSKKLYRSVASKKLRSMYLTIRLFGYVWNMLVSLLLFGTSEGDRVKLIDTVSNAVLHRQPSRKVASLLLAKLRAVQEIVSTPDTGVNKIRSENIILGTVANNLIEELREVIGIKCEDSNNEHRDSEEHAW